MALTELSGGRTSIRLDTDQVEMALAKRAAEETHNRLSGEGSYASCTFSFEYMPPGEEVTFLEARQVIKLDEWYLVCADHSELAPDDEQTGIIFLMVRDPDSEQWIAKDSYREFDRDDPTRLTFSKICYLAAAMEDAE